MYAVIPREKSDGGGGSQCDLLPLAKMETTRL